MSNIFDINDTKTGQKEFHEFFNKDTKDLLGNKGVLQFILKRLYSGFYSPDISGNMVVFLIPPDLSGYKGQVEETLLTQIAKDSAFSAIDFTPPETQLNNSESMSPRNSIFYATMRKNDGQLVVNFIENQDLLIYSFHNIWIQYIYDVTYGNVKPEDKFINSGEIDYAASMFVIKFKPDLNTINYIGKATGIFPTGLSSKEVIGNRNTRDLSIIPVNYVCSDYSDIVVNASTDQQKKAQDLKKENPDHTDNFHLIEELENVLTLYANG